MCGVLLSVCTGTDVHASCEFYQLLPSIMSHVLEFLFNIFINF